MILAYLLVLYSLFYEVHAYQSVNLRCNHVRANSIIHAVSVDPVTGIKPKDSNFTFSLDSIKLPTVNLNDILKLYENLRPHQQHNNDNEENNLDDNENNVNWFGKLKYIRHSTLSGMQNVKMPWDKYYRGEIPFFENINLNEKLGRREDVVAEIMVDEIASRKTKSLTLFAYNVTGMVRRTVGNTLHLFRKVKLLFPITNYIINLGKHEKIRISTITNHLLPYNNEQIVYKYGKIIINFISKYIKSTQNIAKRIAESVLPGLYMISKSIIKNKKIGRGDDSKRPSLLNIVAPINFKLKEDELQYNPITPRNLYLNKFPFPLLTNSDDQDNRDASEDMDTKQVAPKVFTPLNLNLTMNYNITLSDQVPALKASKEYTKFPAEVLMEAGSDGQDVLLGRIPYPSSTDFAYLNHREQILAVKAALAVVTPQDAKEFMKFIGIEPLLNTLVNDDFHNTEISQVDSVKGLCRLIRAEKSIASRVGVLNEVINELTDIIEAPLKGFKSLRSAAEHQKLLIAQKEAMALIQRLVRSSDQAVNYMISNTRLKNVLETVVESHQEVLSHANSTSNFDVVNNDHRLLNMNKAKTKLSGNTTIVEYTNLKTHQMARVASWGLGGLKWKPKQANQKGLRILSFDGGGTRGVLTIAILKELLHKVGRIHAHEMFDIICGTSTGGIIAVLLGGHLHDVHKCELLYDDFVYKIFSKKSNLKLMSDKAMYDDVEFENILYSFVGDELLLDSNKNVCPRVFCVSTKVNNNPPQIQLWRNYNYPLGQQSRYGGSFRVNTLTAIRATTAAPTFFTPIQFDGGLYCDGALVANNPTAVALQEAKALYPNTPIEFVVSIGTGYFSQDSPMQSLGWDSLLNQIIASSVDTEDVHTLLKDFLSPDKYYRLNPLLNDNLPIDETDKTRLNDLKVVAKNYVNNLFAQEPQKMEMLVKMLRKSK